MRKFPYLWRIPNNCIYFHSVSFCFPVSSFKWNSSAFVFQSFSVVGTSGPFFIWGYMLHEIIINQQSWQKWEIVNVFESILAVNTLWLIITLHQVLQAPQKYPLRFPRLHCWTLHSFSCQKGSLSVYDKYKWRSYTTLNKFWYC